MVAAAARALAFALVGAANAFTFQFESFHRAFPGGSSGGRHQQAPPSQPPKDLPNHYKALGVKPNATTQEIRKAFRDKSMKLHPDKAAPSKRTLAEKKYFKISEAYEVLSDKEKRKDYDQERAGQGRGRQVNAEAQREQQRAQRFDKFTADHVAHVGIDAEAEQHLSQRQLPTVIVAYDQQQCPECEAFEDDILSKASTDLRGSVQMVGVNCRSASEICKKYSVAGAGKGPAVYMILMDADAKAKKCPTCTSSANNFRAFINREIPKKHITVVREPVDLVKFDVSVEHGRGKLLVVASKTEAPIRIRSLALRLQSVAIGLVLDNSPVAAALRNQIGHDDAAKIFDVFSVSLANDGDLKLEGRSMDDEPTADKLFSFAVGSAGRARERPPPAVTVLSSAAWQGGVCNKKSSAFCLVVFDAPTGAGKAADAVGSALASDRDRVRVIRPADDAIAAQLGALLGSRPGSNAVVLWRPKRGRYQLIAGDQRPERLVDAVRNLLDAGKQLEQKEARTEL